MMRRERGENGGKREREVRTKSSLPEIPPVAIARVNVDVSLVIRAGRQPDDAPDVERACCTVCPVRPCV